MNTVGDVELHIFYEEAVMKFSKNISKLSGIAAFAAVMLVSSSAFAAMSSDDVEPYLKKQGCYKCHSPDKTKKGPSWKKVSEKSKGKPDDVIKQFTTGPKVKIDGNEEDHKIIETKDKDDWKTIANWILSH